MANLSRQVHKERRHQIPGREASRLKILEEKARAHFIAACDAGKRRSFNRPGLAGRRYPGEAEANYLLAHIEYLSQFPKRKREFLRTLRILRDFEQTIKNRGGRTDGPFEPAVYAVWRKLTRTVQSGRTEIKDVIQEGLVVQPVGPEGTAALSLLSLFFCHWRLTRIRQCLHCGEWFYARFKHQQFCNAPEKKCQWNHYHTPDWRRQHREQNKVHQRSFRDRTFGKRRN
jgi:hypothetical protein